MRYAKIRNEVLTFAPKNKGAMINYNLNIEEMLKDGYKPFLEAETEEAKKYEFSYEETESEIREIATEIIPNEAEIKSSQKQAQIEELKHRLDELDLKSVRALRAVIAGTSTNDDLTRLEEIENQVQTIRTNINEL